MNVEPPIVSRYSNTVETALSVVPLIAQSLALVTFTSTPKPSAVTQPTSRSIRPSVSQQLPKVSINKEAKRAHAPDIQKYQKREDKKRRLMAISEKPSFDAHCVSISNVQARKPELSIFSRECTSHHSSQGTPPTRSQHTSISTAFELRGPESK
ncbi:hypothetical protein BDQ17DRAFT_1370655 [Cyathus striatus]|nr:hypothetical protein BDQ17DRAFT_1370655 [Cyathus striatus]